MAPTSDDAGESPQLSVVLPAHNEVGLLGATVTALVAGLDDRGLDYEIVVVENGSTDGTLRLGRLLVEEVGRLRLLSLPNGDYGAALAAGLGAARGAVVACFDVDYYDLAFLDAALQVLGAGGTDVVLASKRAPGARDRRPWGRRVLTNGFARTARLVLGLEVSDAHGMKVVAAGPLRPIVEACVMRGSVFDVEMVLRATRAGLGVAEIPATVIERRPPRSPVPARAVESLLGLLRLRRRLAGEARAAGACRR